MDIPRSGSAEIEIDGRRLRLTQLDMAMWPVAGVTRGDVVAHYADVGHALLPHVRGRPLTLSRFPAGLTRRGVTSGEFRPLPDWIHMRDGHCVIDDRAGLVWLAAYGMVEIGIDRRAPAWELRAASSGGLRAACRSALRLRDALGPGAVPLSTGAFGIVVVAPRADEVAIPDAPGIEILRPRVVPAPYSLRAMLPAPGACAPLAWDEVEAAEGLEIGPEEVRRRLRERGDLAAPLLDVKP